MNGNTLKAQELVNKDAICNRGLEGSTSGPYGLKANKGARLDSPSTEKSANKSLNK